MKTTLAILISKYEALEIKSDLGLTTEAEETLKDEIYHRMDSILFN